MSEIMNAYRDIVVVNNSQLALALSLDFNRLPSNDQRPAFAGSPLAGYFYLIRKDEISRDTVMETVVSPFGDSITSLYKNHRVFATPGELLKAREAMVRALADKIGLSPEAIGIDDAGRGRALGLDELSTGQLIDLFAEKMGHTIITTDSHAAMPATLTVGNDGGIVIG